MLVGSFFLQLMGLVSPIFFQLVIDKVLVHHSMSTLDVLVIGLAVVMIWETLLSGLRNWLFAHSTNRVDAELGAAVPSPAAVAAVLFRGPPGRATAWPGCVNWSASESS